MDDCGWVGYGGLLSRGQSWRITEQTNRSISQSTSRNSNKLLGENPNGTGVVVLDCRISALIHELSRRNCFVSNCYQ